MPFGGKHIKRSKAAITGWRITVPIKAAVQAATQNTGWTPVSSANPKPKLTPEKITGKNARRTNRS